LKPLSPTARTIRKSPFRRRAATGRDQLLRQALTNLSTDHRNIIDLVYFHERSVEECALILGIPAATVKTRMFYARKKLAELVREA